MAGWRGLNEHAIVHSSDNLQHLLADHDTWQNEFNDVVSADFSHSFWSKRLRDYALDFYSIEVPDIIITFMRRHQSGDHAPLELSHDDASLDQMKRFKTLVTRALRRLGNCAFVKGNFSSAKDATNFISNNQMIIQSFDDIMIILEKSGRLLNDFMKVQRIIWDRNGRVLKPVLVLKRWVACHPGTEFRAFVYHGCLVGITQRNSDVYNYISKTAQDIKVDIVWFYEVILSRRFPGLTYVFDVIRLPSGQIILVDINEFTIEKDLGLFAWNTLLRSCRIHFVGRLQYKPTFLYVPMATHFLNEENQVAVFESFNELMSGFQDTFPRYMSCPLLHLPHIL